MVMNQRVPAPSLALLPALGQRQSRLLPGMQPALQVVYRSKALFAQGRAQLVGLIAAAAAYNERAVTVFIEFAGGFVIVCRHLNGIHDMAVTIILVIAHINQDGAFMIDQTDRLARRNITDLAHAVTEFDTRKQGKYDNKGGYQK